MTRPSCAEFEPLIARAADDAIAPDERARLDVHLQSCGECRATLADQRAVREVLAMRPPLYARPDFAMRVTSAIAADRSWIDRLDFRLWTWRLVPLAAALSVVTWFVARNVSTAGDTTTPDAVAAAAADVPVAAALWDDSVSDTALLSLMLRAGANDSLADSYKER